MPTFRNFLASKYYSSICRGDMYLSPWLTNFFHLISYSSPAHPGAGKPLFPQHHVESPSNSGARAANSVREHPVGEEQQNIIYQPTRWIHLPLENFSSSWYHTSLAFLDNYAISYLIINQVSLWEVIVDRDHVGGESLYAVLLTRKQPPQVRYISDVLFFQWHQAFS